MKNSFWWLISITFLVRVVTVFLIGKTPCMEPSYLYQGEQIFIGSSDTLYLSSFYSIIVYVLTTIFGSLFIASSVIFILGSTIVSAMIYCICETLFDKKTATYGLLFALFIPNLTVAISGFAHSVILGAAFDLSAIYFILIYYKRNSLIDLLWAGILSVFSIFTRPETLIILVPFFIIYGLYVLFVSSNVFNTKVIRNGFIYVLFVFTLIIGHKQFVLSNSNNQATAGIFSDSKYSYFTFIHTYSMRYFNDINDEKAIVASKPFIGSPEENNYSIATAIKKNPKQFLSNILYNIKEFLDFIGHPLFIPVFFYFCLGALFMKLDLKELKGIYVVLGLLFLHIIPLLIFHVSIKYMGVVCAFTLITIALGASKLNLSTFVSSALIGLCFIVYLMYLVNNVLAVSLCG